MDEWIVMLNLQQDPDQLRLSDGEMQRLQAVLNCRVIGTSDSNVPREFSCTIVYGATDAASAETEARKQASAALETEGISGWAVVDATCLGNDGVEVDP